MKYNVQFTNQFKKDYKLAKKQNKNLHKLFKVIDTLANGDTLDAKYKDHEDVLILLLSRLGSHSNLF